MLLLLERSASPGRGRLRKNSSRRRTRRAIRPTTGGSSRMSLGASTGRRSRMCLPSAPAGVAWADREPGSCGARGHRVLGNRGAGARGLSDRDSPLPGERREAHGGGRRPVGPSRLGPGDCRARASERFSSAAHLRVLGRAQFTPRPTRRRRNGPIRIGPISGRRCQLCAGAGRFCRAVRHQSGLQGGRHRSGPVDRHCERVERGPEPGGGLPDAFRSDGEPAPGGGGRVRSGGEHGGGGGRPGHGAGGVGGPGAKVGTVHIGGRR